MVDRRSVFTGAGMIAALATPAASLFAHPNSVPTPPKGPWTGQGRIRRAGGYLNYATVGPENSGRPPIIMLHRLGGWLSDWRHVAAILGKNRKVIAFDLPGHGGSVWDGPPPYIQTIGETASMLVGAFDEMGIDTVDLMGTSLGGCVAVPLAAFRPERVNTLSIVSSALSPKRSLATIRQVVDDGQKDRFDANGYPLPYRESLLTETFGIVDTHDIYVEGLASRVAAGHWIQPSERGVGISDIVGTLSRVNAPTHILYGARDKAYGKYRTAAMAALPSAKFADIPDSGAFAIQERPEVTAQMLSSFLD